MSTSILATKLYLPHLRPNIVSRPGLIARLNEGLHHKLTLIAAPAGFGKTTLVSTWLQGSKRPLAWLSLEEEENDPVRFLTYLIAAVQTIAPGLGEGISNALQSPQLPPIETLLVALLNELAMLKEPFILVFDDYHVIDARAVGQALNYLVNHLPPHMHLVIVTREDPPLSLARLRARDQLTEVRATDLRFTLSESATFLTQVMGISLSDQDIAALEKRTEGWITGLQFAALALQGHQDRTGFITSFTGSHHFVLDYLVAEVLEQQEPAVKTFLLHTSILERMSGPLCDAVVLDSSVSGQTMLEYLERANLFVIPLDNERRWYRYHHLFAELLRKLLQSTTVLSTDNDSNLLIALHQRASVWYEAHDLQLEAFHHAVAAQDVEHATRLLESDGMSLPFPGAVAPVLAFLESLSPAQLDARPSLWVVYASALLFVGQDVVTIEAKLKAADAALQESEADDSTRDLRGRIASLRATLAVMQHDIASIIEQSRFALSCLHPQKLSLRAAATWTLGYASQLQGDRATAIQAYSEIISRSQSLGNSIYTIAATVSLGQVQETNIQLPLAAKTYQRALQLAGDPPLSIACEAHLGLARILYQWNDLDAAWQHVQQCLQMTQQMTSIDTFALSTLLLARLKLFQGDVDGAAILVDEAEAFVLQHNFVYRLADVAAARVLLMLRQDRLAAAAELAQMYRLPLAQARVYLALGDPSAALAVLSPWREQAEAREWPDERLQAMVLQSLALQSLGEQDQALLLLCDALEYAAPHGFIRLFVDEDRPMAHLLSQVKALGSRPDYIEKLLIVLNAQASAHEDSASPLSLVAQPPAQSLIEPLSRREIEVLQLIAQGLSNQEISQRLVLALETVKGHNKKIFGKLQVQRRTEAVARARQLGLL